METLRRQFLEQGGSEVEEDCAPVRTWCDVKRVLFKESVKLWKIAGAINFYALCMFGVTISTIIFAGHIGEIELSAVYISLSFIGIFPLGLLLGICAALLSHCSKKIGAGKVNELGVYLQRFWIISFISCIFLLPVYIYATPFLRLLGESDEIAVSAGDFTLLTIPHLFSVAFTFPTMMFLIAQGKLMVMSFFWSIALFLHVCLLWLFIIVFGWGTNGAALAFNITNWGTAISLIVYVVNWCNEGWSGLSWLAFRNIRFFAGLSIACGIMISVKFWFLDSISVLTGRLDNDIIAVDSLFICISLNIMELALFSGINNAISVRVAYELGKARPRAAKYSVYVALFESLLIGVVLMVAIIMARDHFAILFTSSEVLQRDLSKLAYLLGITMVLNSVQQVITGVAVGSGWESTVTSINVGCYCLFSLPFSYFLGYKENLGVMGIWTKNIAGIAPQTLILMFVLYNIDWNKEVEMARGRMNGPTAQQTRELFIILAWIECRFCCISCYSDFEIWYNRVIRRDESLLSQGLALNDDLERVSTSYEAIASGIPGTSIQIEKLKSETGKSLVYVNGPPIDSGESSNQANGATSSSSNGVLNQLALPAPPVANGSVNSKIDLLSGDDLALVPVRPPQPASTVASDQNALALINMFSDNTSSPSPATAPTGNSAPESSPLTPQLHQQPTSRAGEAELQPSNGFSPQAGYLQFEQQPSYGQGASSPWNSHDTPMEVYYSEKKRGKQVLDVGKESVGEEVAGTSKEKQEVWRDWA